MQSGSVSTFLYVPAHSDRPLAKALGGHTGADVVIVDLEDGVPAAARDAAVSNLRALECRPVNSPAVLCRVRSGTGRREEDLKEVPSWFDGVVLAKAEDADDLVRVSSEIARLGRSFGIWLLIETARAVESLSYILSAGPQIRGLMLGAGDLLADLGLRSAGDSRLLDHARARIVLAASAARIDDVVDTPEAELEPSEHFAAATRNARDLGFTGKAAIHPAQLPVIRETFRFSSQEIGWAESVLGTADGAQRLDGHLTDEAVKRRARRILVSASQRTEEDWI